MHTPISRPGPLDVPQKPSPSMPKPRVARKLKTPGSNSDSVSSPSPVGKTPKDRSPKVVDRRSPRIPVAENKRANKVSELEPQIAQLQEELKAAKEQLVLSESWKGRAQHEAEEAKKQLAIMSAKLEESQKQLKELYEFDEARVQELRKISQDRDRAWQSELEAVQKQYAMDSAALASAMNDIQKLKIQLDRVSQSEASQARHAESAHAEIQSLKIELTETLILVEKLKDQLNESREYEAQALEEVSRAQKQLTAVKNTEKRLESEYANIMKSYDSLLGELEESKNRVRSLEELVAIKTSSQNGDSDESENLNSEVNDLRSEVSELRSSLEDAERRYRDEYIQSTLQIRNAYQLVDQVKSQSCQKEAELDAKIKGSMDEVGKLRAKLTEKENAVQIFSCENQTDESALKDLKTSLLDKEVMLQTIAEENEKLKSEMMRTETDRRKENNEALMKVESLSEETDISCKKVARVTQELDATQATNNELEAELRRLKVQCDQWRKAAEVAAAMLTNGNNGKYVERTGSLDYITIGKKMSPPNCEDTDDDSPKKKNGNMLKKIGVLLKKGPK